jgi:type I restriction enzyme M protein
VFYNTSDWTLKKLVQTAANNRQILEANFKAYLDGYGGNIKEIIEKFELRNQIKRMVDNDVLLDVLEKFTSDRINLGPHKAVDPDGRKLPPIKAVTADILKLEKETEGLLKKIVSFKGWDR